MQLELYLKILNKTNEIMLILKIPFFSMYVVSNKLKKKTKKVD